MRTVLIFLPKILRTYKSGYLKGSVSHNDQSETVRFYVTHVEDKNNLNEPENACNTIGYYYSNTNFHIPYVSQFKKDHFNWVNIQSKCDPTSGTTYIPKTIVIQGCTELPISSIHIIIIFYDSVTLRDSQLFDDRTSLGDFYELACIVKNVEGFQNNKSNHAKSRWCFKSLLLQLLNSWLLVICFAHKTTNRLLPVLKYSSLGLHINEWLSNVKWTLADIMQYKKLSGTSGNFIFAFIADMALGIFVLQILPKCIIYESPSQMLLENAEKVVDSLKHLIQWLMGAPAGLKLNCALNDTLGRFFLYHIQLWWTFLISVKPVMDFAFEVLMLIGRLGITFQLAIAADLLSLLSFHAYCIYVYAARLFNMQLKGITALFRLFLGKKKNPLRQRIDSCQYQADQLFVGTLLFTILLFLMPTTWSYYTVFTVLRLASIGFGGFLTRLKYYLQIMPIYTFTKWCLRSASFCGTLDIKLHPQRKDREPLILYTNVSVASWRRIWKKFIPKTVTRHPPIKWNDILNNVIWGELLYPM